MDVEQHIEAYIQSLASAKAAEMRELHQRILQLMPGAQLWFLDGKNAEGKIVSNPNIGYGTLAMRSRDFYRIGLSGNTTGISVYIMGLADRSYLAATYGKTLGKASVTGYCIKFKSLKDIQLEVLEAAIRDGAGRDC